MSVGDDAGAPMTRGNVSNGQGITLDAVPPVEFNDLREAEVSYEIEHVMRHNDDRSFAMLAFCMLHERAQ